MQAVVSLTDTGHVHRRDFTSPDAAREWADGFRVRRPKTSRTVYVEMLWDCEGRHAPEQDFEDRPEPTKKGRQAPARETEQQREEANVAV